MATTKTTAVVETPIPETNDPLYRAKGFWDRYSKAIIYVGSAIILLIVGWFAYQHFIKLPREKEANKQIIAAEAIVDKMGTTGFNKDSVGLALNGGAVEGKKITGLLKVISNYGGTKAGNRAKYLVGASYLQVGDYDKAIKYLKEYEGNDAKQVQSLAYKMLGDAYAQKKNTDEAFSYYKKAASVNEKDESFTPNILMIAASYAQAIGKSKDAVELYKKVKDKYPTSSPVTNGDVDKELASLGEFN